MNNKWQEFRVAFGSLPETLQDEITAAAAALPGVCGCDQTGMTADKQVPSWRFYLEEFADAAVFEQDLRQLAQSFNISEMDVAGPYSLERQNWMYGWRDHFKPLNIGSRLTIVPSWNADAVASARSEGRMPILLEPGMAFGTGTHATTQLCLRLAEKELRQGDRVLDVGTGSGVLAIAALKLGASYCCCVDTDPEVEENFRENALLNEVLDQRVNLVIGRLESLQQSGFTFVFCNMLLHEFTPLLPLIPAYMNEGGTLVLSGILDQEHTEVIKLLEPHPLVLEQTEISGEWEAMVVRRT